MTLATRLRSEAARYWRELRSIHREPWEVALGFAVGTVIGVLPTPGFSVLLGLLVVLAVPRVSKLALLVALAVWNPFLTLPLHGLSLKLGNALFAGEPVVAVDVALWQQVWHYTRRYLVGSAIIALILGTASFAVVYVGARRSRRGRGPSRPRARQKSV